MRLHLSQERLSLKGEADGIAHPKRMSAGNPTCRMDALSGGGLVRSYGHQQVGDEH